MACKLNANGSRSRLAPAKTARSLARSSPAKGSFAECTQFSSIVNDDRVVTLTVIEIQTIKYRVLGRTHVRINSERQSVR
jgi:hypothetical protein